MTCCSHGAVKQVTLVQDTMAAEAPSPLTTHVLNTADGVPAARMPVSLHRLDSELKLWNMMTVG